MSATGRSVATYIRPFPFIHARTRRVPFARLLDDIWFVVVQVLAWATWMVILGLLRLGARFLGWDALTVDVFAGCFAVLITVVAAVELVAGLLAKPPGVEEVEPR